MEESIEAGEFKISIFNAFQSTYDTRKDLDMDLQYRMINPMAFLYEILGDMMYFHQYMAQEESGNFVEAVVKEVNVHVDNTHCKLVPIK